ncbi:MAG TPA: tetratricopeptide repeat protein [Opitutaceae bacterium]
MTPPSEPAEGGRWNPWPIAALILALVLAAYWPALNGGFVWDDDGHVTKPGLRSLSGLFEIWFNVHSTQQYYPLLHSVFWLEHGLWGDAPLGYHLANVLEHAAAAVLLVAALRRLRLPGAELAGVLFAVHPVCVESVAWISEQKNTFSLVLYLLAGLSYLRFDQDPGAPGGRRHYRRASLFFVLALLTKTVTATLPAALLVIAWWRRGAVTWRRDGRPLAPWLAAGAACGLFTAWVEKTIIGAEGSAFSLDLWDRCLLAGRVVWFYLGKLAWPADLIFIYPRWNAETGAAGWALYLAAAIVVTAALCVAARRARGPLAAWLFFVGSLFPALGFVNVYPFIFSYVADHFQYLPCIGVFAALSAGAAGLAARSGAGARRGWMAGAAAVVGLLCVLSNLQSRAYADEATLYRVTIARNPGCWMAHNNLGLWYKTHGEEAKALGEYEEALRLRRDYPQALNNLGVLYEDRGDLGQAQARFMAALGIWKDFVAAHNNLGTVYARLPGRGPDAIAQFREALRLQPEFASAYDNLGAELMRQPGHVNEAIAQFQQALRVRPDFPDAHTHLGNAYADLPGRMGDAIAEYEASIRERPADPEAQSNLGLALAAAGRPDEAIDHYREALRLSPGSAEIRFNLALALLSEPGRQAEAAAQLEAFLQAHPENQTARQLLQQARSGGP